MAWAEAFRLAPHVLRLQHDYPSWLGSTWQVDRPVVRSMLQRVRSVEEKCPSSLDAKAAGLILKVFLTGQQQGLIKADFSDKPGMLKIPKLPLEIAEVHPELALLLLYSAPIDRQLLQTSIHRWPYRVEFWHLLTMGEAAEEVVLQAIRRVLD